MKLKFSALSWLLPGQPRPKHLLCDQGKQEIPTASTAITGPGPNGDAEAVGTAGSTMLAGVTLVMCRPAATGARLPAQERMSRKRRLQGRALKNYIDSCKRRRAFCLSEEFGLQKNFQRIETGRASNITFPRPPGLRQRFRPEALGADTPVEAESHRRGAGAVRVLGFELVDDPVRRRQRADLAQARVVRHVAGGMPVSIDASVACIDPAIAGRRRYSGKLPDVGALTVVQSLAAGGPANLGDERIHIFPDELIAGVRRRPHLLLRPRTASQRGT
jgi:hypothetical protein